MKGLQKLLYDSVNSKHAHRPPQAFVIFLIGKLQMPAPTVGSVDTCIQNPTMEIKVGTNAPGIKAKVTCMPPCKKLKIVTVKFRKWKTGYKNAEGE